MRKTLYLDWNVFNKLEDLNRGTLPTPEEVEIYTKINQKVLDAEFDVPYSNAHLSDLLRGFLKDPKYTPAHLESISAITGNLCIVQYWKKDNATAHYRDVKVLFQEMIDEVGFLPDNFEDLIIGLNEETDNPYLEEGFSERVQTINKDLEALIKKGVPKGFKQLLAMDSMFKIIYPSAKTKNTTLAMLDDLYKFSMRINKDYSLYKALKKYINASVQKIKEYKHLMTVGDVGPDGHKYLSYDEIFEKSKPDFEPHENPYYDRIINLFLKLDMSGENSDDRFPNMFDDSLHTFYAAHCDYFISRDAKCRIKAKKVYEKLGITTLVMSPDEFAKYLENGKTNPVH